MTSILKTDEIQSQNGGAVVKMQTLKHPSASGNNLELASDGNVSITNTLSAGTIGSGVTGAGLITMFDQFYIEDDFIGNGATITPWTRVTASTHTGYSPLNTGLTKASGVFSFPENGLYLVQGTFTIQGSSGGDDNIGIRLQVTVNSSTYLTRVQAISEVNNTQTTGNVSIGPTLINCTDKDNVKFRWQAYSISTGNNIRGTDSETSGSPAEDKIYTNFSVMRIGISQ